MEKKPPRPMPPFDELTIPAELQTLKLLLPYTPVSEQQSLWILIKFMELQHTIQFFRQQQNRLHSQTFRRFPVSMAEMLEEITPYLPPEEAEMLNTFRNVMNIMEMMQMFQENTDASESPPEKHSADTGSPGQQSPFHFDSMNPMDLMMGMLSPEQQEMFRMYQSMFSDMDDFDSDSSDTDSSETPSAYDNSSGSGTSDVDNLNPTVPDAGNLNPDNSDF